MSAKPDKHIKDALLGKRHDYDKEKPRSMQATATELGFSEAEIKKLDEIYKRELEQNHEKK